MSEVLTVCLSRLLRRRALGRPGWRGGSTVYAWCERDLRFRDNGLFVGTRVTVRLGSPTSNVH